MMLRLTLLLRLSWRNMWRYRRRNLSLSFALALAVASLVVAAGFLRGWQTGAHDDALDALVGNIKVTQPGFLDNPRAALGFLPSAALVESLDAARVQWTARVVLPVVVMSERETRGVQLAGIDPARDAAMTFLREARVVGRKLRDVHDGGLLLGAALAERLDTGVGKRVVVRVERADGGSAETGMTIVGLFDAGNTGSELAYAFVGRSRLQHLVGNGAQVTEISLRMPDAQQASWAKALHEQLPKLDVRTWRQLAPQMAAMIDLADAGILVFAIVLMIALAFGVANTLISAVLERTREIGLLHVLGMPRGAIVGQVVLESLFIVALGLVGGVALGLIGAWWWRDGIDLTRWSAGVEATGIHSRIMLYLQWRDIANDAIVVLVLGVFGSLYPAWRAVHLEPLEALHGRKG